MEPELPVPPHHVHAAVGDENHAGVGRDQGGRAGTGEAGRQRHRQESEPADAPLAPERAHRPRGPGGLAAPDRSALAAYSRSRTQQREPRLGAGDQLLEVWIPALSRHGPAHRPGGGGAEREERPGDILGGPGEGLLAEGPSRPAEGHAGRSVGKLDLHRRDARPERALDLLAAADQLEDVQERGSLELPAVRGAGDPDPTRAEQRSERGGMTSRCALEQRRAVVQLQRQGASRCAEAEAERRDRPRRREARRMAQGAEALADGAPARCGNGGLLEVAEELLAHPDHGLAPLGPVEPDPAHESGGPGQRRDAQGAAVLGVLQAEDEAGLGQ